MLRILAGLHQLANKMVCGMNGMINMRTNGETLIIDAIEESDSAYQEEELWW